MISHMSMARPEQQLSIQDSISEEDEDDSAPDYDEEERSHRLSGDSSEEIASMPNSERGLQNLRDRIRRFGQNQRQRRPRVTAQNFRKLYNEGQLI
jgi:hypothetical protein